MNIILLGAAGFIGTNLALELAKDKNNVITVVDKENTYFKTLEQMSTQRFQFIESDLTMNDDYEVLVKGQDLVYHLISTTVPTTSNQHIAEERYIYEQLKKSKNIDCQLLFISDIIEISPSDKQLVIESRLNYVFSEALIIIFAPSFSAVSALPDS